MRKFVGWNIYLKKLLRMQDRKPRMKIPKMGIQNKMKKRFKDPKY